MKGTKKKKRSAQESMEIREEISEMFKKSHILFEFCQDQGWRPFESVGALSTAASKIAGMLLAAADEDE